MAADKVVGEKRWGGSAGVSLLDTPGFGGTAVSGRRRAAVDF